MIWITFFAVSILYSVILHRQHLRIWALQNDAGRTNELMDQLNDLIGSVDEANNARYELLLEQGRRIDNLANDFRLS